MSRLVDERAGRRVSTRDQAIRLSVVNRARDIVCGVLSTLPLTRLRGDLRDPESLEDLGPGWLERPDPDHTRGWFVAGVTDDLFFHQHAYARVTAWDADLRPVALQWMPYREVIRDEDALGVTWFPTDRWLVPLESVAVDRSALVEFESPLLGVLRGGEDILTTAALLDSAAGRFAGVDIPAGWFSQKAGFEEMTDDEIEEFLERWWAARQFNTTGYHNDALEYHESQMDPSRLQLVEGRAYQDAALARLCNLPNYTLGVGVPNDSMTYKTALTARLDVIDFGLAPFIGCIEQTLSANAITPRGTHVQMVLEPFTRTSVLTTAARAGMSSTTREVAQ